MTRVGLTGGVASGKSTVSALLAELGAVVIDADVLAREVVEPGSPALDEIRERWGSVVFHADGTLDRQALGRIVFADEVGFGNAAALRHHFTRDRGVSPQRYRRTFSRTA